MESPTNSNANYLCLYYSDLVAAGAERDPYREKPAEQPFSIEGRSAGYMIADYL